MARGILSTGLVQEPWTRLPAAALINRLNERTRPKKRPAKPDWDTLLSPEEKTLVGSLVVAPSRRDPSPPNRSLQPKKEPAPFDILRERWLALDSTKRSLKRVVASSASEFPGILLGEFSRASVALRDEESGEEDEQKSKGTAPKKAKKKVSKRVMKTRKRIRLVAAANIVKGRSPTRLTP